MRRQVERRMEVRTHIHTSRSREGISFFLQWHFFGEKVGLHTTCKTYAYSTDTHTCSCMHENTQQPRHHVSCADRFNQSGASLRLPFSCWLSDWSFTSSNQTPLTTMIYYMASWGVTALFCVTSSDKTWMIINAKVKHVNKWVYSRCHDNYLRKICSVLCPYYSTAVLCSCHLISSADSSQAIIKFYVLSTVL